MKYDETELIPIKLNINNDGNTDCVIADAANNFKPKLVSCLESYTVSCLVITLCLFNKSEK